MAKTIFTQQEVEAYFSGGKRHHFYNKAKALSEAMLVHADGVYPEKLLKERRPNESEEVQQYRTKIWQPKTKPTFSKVFSSLQKIRRSQDWSINYPDLAQFTRVAEEESLEEYCEHRFPYFASVTNWVFSVYLRKYLCDANALVVVLPMEWEVAENEYRKPVAQLFDSEQVLDFVDEDYAVLLNPMGAEYQIGRGKTAKGKSIYIITTLEFLQYDQVNSKGDFLLVDQVAHGLNVLPVFQTKGVFIDTAKNKYLYESRLSGMLPELNEALREYSDLQAAKVLHLYPERWEYTQNECRDCKGKGRRPNPNWVDGSALPYDIDCATCGGHGYQVAGPYSKLLVKPVSAIDGGQQVPTPPVGYAEKDTEIIKVMEASVETHIQNALSAINFDFISAVPGAESGVAKSYDRDESNNMVHSIAEDLVWAMDNVYALIALYRYGGVYGAEEIASMLPKIPVPDRFDLLSTDTLQKELKDAKDAKQNPILLNALEIEYAGKRFNTSDEVRDELLLSLKLDPLCNIPDDSKMARLTNKGITQQTYVISSNIQEFIQRAMIEDAGFAGRNIAEQRAVMQRYAEELIASQSMEAEVLAEPIEETMPDTATVDEGGEEEPTVMEDAEEEMMSNEEQQ